MNLYYVYMYRTMKCLLVTDLSYFIRSGVQNVTNQLSFILRCIFFYIFRILVKEILYKCAKNIENPQNNI